MPIEGEMAGNPMVIVHSQWGAGGDQKPILTHAGHREVGFDASPAVEHLGVHHAAGFYANLIGAKLL